MNIRNSKIVFDFVKIYCTRILKFQLCAHEQMRDQFGHYTNVLPLQNWAIAWKPLKFLFISYWKDCLLYCYHKRQWCSCIIVFLYSFFMKLTEPLACTCGNYITEHELSIEMNIRNSKIVFDFVKIYCMRILKFQLCAHEQMRDQFGHYKNVLPLQNWAIGSHWISSSYYVEKKMPIILLSQASIIQLYHRFL